MTAVDVGPKDTLAAALGIGDRSCVAFVGAGGKTTALQRLCAELAAGRRRLIATTTTAMFLSELAAFGPVLTRRADAAWAGELEAALAAVGAVAVIAGERADGKARGLSPEAVDELWTSGVADHVVVEADGSRGLPLKAFGSDEPQVPAAAGLVVVVAGLDALGAPLVEDRVHRAGLLADLLGVPAGVEVTPSVVVGALRNQVAQVAGMAAPRRCVVLLNKADHAGRLAAGRAIAADLLAGGGTRAGQIGEAGVPDAVLVGSLRDGRLERHDADAADARRRASVAAVVLAAGRATRMGGAKLLLPVNGRPMVRRVVDAALVSSVSQVVVVVGHERDAVTAALAGAPVVTVENPDYAAGMSTSLRAGLAAIDAAADGVLILLGDQPFVTAALIDALVESFTASGSAVVRPSVAGVPGNPVLVRAALIPQLMAETGDVGGRRVVDRHGDDVCLVDIADARELLDVDSPDEYEKVRET